MTIQQLRATLKAVPFRPFDVHMADGRSFHIRHPDFLLMSPSGAWPSPSARMTNAASSTSC